MTSPRRSRGGFTIVIGKQHEKFAARNKRICWKAPENDKSRMTNVKGMSKSVCQIVGNHPSHADLRFGNSGFLGHLSFVIRISRARCLISSQAHRNVSHSPAVTRASKRSAAHAKLHLARADRAGGDHWRLRPQAQRSRGWRD